MNSPTTTVSWLLRRGESYLVGRGVPNARRNAEWLLSHVLDCRAADLYLDTSYAPAPLQVGAYKRLLQRRGSREPLQYILGTTEFMSLSFCLAAGVFIPRPDTEVLVERIEPYLAMLEGREAIGARDAGGVQMADLCCGSGVIAISLAKRVGGVRAVAVDLSPAAVDLAAKNAELNGVADRVECVRGEAVAFLAQTSTRFDAIVCNPPYVATGDIEALPPEIKLHEPRLGLDGGASGLDFYRAAAPMLRRALKPGGVVAFEIGSDQAESVRALLADEAFEHITVHRDYADHDRVVIAEMSREPTPEPCHG
jgi:release factor glutamine methyltransferase